MRDWAAWHEAYDDPSSFLNVRLRKVRQRLSEAIGAAACRARANGQPLRRPGP